MDYIRNFGLLFSIQLLLLILQETTINCGDAPPPPPQYWETPYSQPYFDNTTRREITATVGQAAQLHCRVRNLGDRAVSWIRKRDLHILTVGILTYTNDQRFQSLHTEGSDEWTLRISPPQPRDSGTYECQVSTEPKISQGFRLNVVVSRAKILGNSELFIKSGSDINLTCLTLRSSVPPSFIYWYKGKRVMNYSQREGISVITERATRTSKLLIAKATSLDSGNYTCAPSNSDSASVIVHVINGEHPAAMQHGNSSSLSTSLHAAISCRNALLATIIATTITTISSSWSWSTSSSSSNSISSSCISNKIIATTAGIALDYRTLFVLIQHPLQRLFSVILCVLSSCLLAFNEPLLSTQLIYNRLKVSINR